MPTSQMLQCAASGREGVMRLMPTMASPARLPPRALMPRASARVLAACARIPQLPSSTCGPRAEAKSPPAHRNPLIR